MVGDLSDLRELRELREQCAPVDGVVSGAGGVPIAYRDYGGEGRGLVLLHGIGGNIEAMDHIARRLGADRRVVSIDVRFNGQSGEAERFRYADCAGDIEAVAAELGLAELDVVGHSLGGVAAGYYGVRHPEARVVTIDGFGGGMTGNGTPEDAEELGRFVERARQQLDAFAPPPEEGDLAWKQAQAMVMGHIMRAVGYAAPNLDQVVERYFVRLPDGTYRRHPTRQLVEDWLEDWSTAASRNILYPFRDCAGATLIIRCTESDWPSVLDSELDSLAAARPNVAVVRLPVTHFAPWWSAFNETTAVIEEFLRTTGG